jgi:hypothetical protein
LTPSQDKVSAKANQWLVEEGLVSSGPVRPRGTGQAEPGQRGSRTERREMSGQLQRLARRLRKDPDELAKQIPADTIRRTKYPVLESVEDGKRFFKHDPGVVEGRIAELRK